MDEKIWEDIEYFIKEIAAIQNTTPHEAILRAVRLYYSKVMAESLKNQLNGLEQSKKDNDNKS